MTVAVAALADVEFVTATPLLRRKIVFGGGIANVTTTRVLLVTNRSALDRIMEIVTVAYVSVALDGRYTIFSFLVLVCNILLPFRLFYFLDYITVW